MSASTVKEKTTQKVAAQDRTGLYDIGAVSRITGLSLPNLRMWEKRHAAVRPVRTETQRRLYTREDVRKLTLLKTLVEHGHSISSIASFDLGELERRLQEEGAVPQLLTTAPEEVETCRVATVGSQIGAMLEANPGCLPESEIVAHALSLPESADAFRNTAADLLLVDCPTLFPDTLKEVRELAGKIGARRAVVIYRFGERRTIDMLAAGVHGVSALRAPIDVNELRLACGAPLPAMAAPVAGAEDSAVIPERQFSDQQLVQLTKISSTVQCECPKHLGNLLFSLVAFEEYSLQCENRNEDDALLHAELHRVTARARASIEGALQHLIEVEGIEVA